MKKRAGFICIGLLAVLSGCGIIGKSPKTEFTNGYYHLKTDNRRQSVYVDIKDDTLYVHPAQRVNNTIQPDTSKSVIVFQKQLNNQLYPHSSLSKNSFDMDFLTMPLKFRPGQKQVPNQLNANLNGALYLGYRTDKFKINYIPNPLKSTNRTITHYGFSLGIFTGFGNTAMTPTTTGNSITMEYDGVVWTKGLAGIIAVNNFTVGLSVGFDNLMDKNRTIWIYESKPWYGLAFGLNLN
ncbi:MAG: hypothetical protein V4613_03835 [Bacteroidota bacterium]